MIRTVSHSALRVRLSLLYNFAAHANLLQALYEMGARIVNEFGEGRSQWDLGTKFRKGVFVGHRS